MIEEIHVPVATPVLPLILADQKFLRTLAEIELQAAAVKITDAQSAQHAANLQIRLTDAGKKLNEAKLALKRPFIDINAKIDETARGPQQRIEETKKILRIAQIQWDLDQRRIASEAEEKRQAELKRLEAIRAAEEAAAKKRAAEIAAEAKRLADEAAKAGAPEVMDVDFGDEPMEPPPKTATELEIERVKFAPAPVAHKPVGVAIRVSLRHKVDKIADLPDAFVIKTANDAGIRATFCNGYKDGEPLPVCPGVTFWVERTPVSTGKVGF